MIHGLKTSTISKILSFSYHPIRYSSPCQSVNIIDDGYFFSFHTTATILSEPFGSTYLLTTNVHLYLIHVHGKEKSAHYINKLYKAMQQPSPTCPWYKRIWNSRGNARDNFLFWRALNNVLLTQDK